MLLRLDQSVQELSAISSQSCQASDCHCRKMLHRLDQICELQWQSEERQIWLPMAGGSCTGWSNLRSIGPIYEVYRYVSTWFLRSAGRPRTTNFKFQYHFRPFTLFRFPPMLTLIWKKQQPICYFWKLWIFSLKFLMIHRFS